MRDIFIACFICVSILFCARLYAVKPTKLTLNESFRLWSRKTFKQPWEIKSTKCKQKLCYATLRYPNHQPVSIVAEPTNHGFTVIRIN